MKKRFEMRGGCRLSPGRVVDAFWSLLNGMGPKARADLRTEMEKQKAEGSHDADTMLACLDQFDEDMKATIAIAIAQGIGGYKPPGDGMGGPG